MPDYIIPEVSAICGDLRNLLFSPTNPYAFTEHGAIMAASVLNSPKAVEVSLLVVRAFVKMKDTLLQYEELRTKLAELEAKTNQHDDTIQELIASIQSLLQMNEGRPSRPIGFTQPLEPKEAAHVEPTTPL